MCGGTFFTQASQQPGNQTSRVADLIVDCTGGPANTELLASLTGSTGSQERVNKKGFPVHSTLEVCVCVLKALCVALIRGMCVKADSDPVRCLASI